MKTQSTAAFKKEREAMKPKMDAHKIIEEKQIDEETIIPLSDEAYFEQVLSEIS